MEIRLSRIEKFIRGHLQYYNEKKYWKRRNIIMNNASHFPKFLKYYYLYYIKKTDAFNNATLGTHIGFGASFKDIPNFPHGLYGIVISHNAIIGKNVTIYHQVTIGEGKNGAPQIGDNVIIGAGAIVIGNVIIGNRVKIGAGCVVTNSIPDDATVVMKKPRIILKR